MTALDRRPPPLPDVHPLVTESARRHRGLWAGASGDLYHALLPTIIEQRITSGEAKRSGAAVPRARRAGARTGPRPDAAAAPRAPRRPAGVVVPPARHRDQAGPAARRVGRLADRLWDWVRLPPAEVAGRLALVAASVRGRSAPCSVRCCGDDDAVAVGDYHLPNLVAWNLAGEARADDARMLSLLEPYRGPGRVIRLLALLGRHAPAFGPRRRILPMHRW